MIRHTTRIEIKSFRRKKKSERYCLGFHTAQKNGSLIEVNNTQPLADQFGTLFHEFAHSAFHLLLKDAAIDPENEHSLCEAIDRAARRELLKYVKGQ